MSHPLTIELSEFAYACLERRAGESAQSPAAFAANALEQQFGHSPAQKLTDDEVQAARSRFERHFGAVDLGYATGVDNEAIDADLAQEYAGAPEGR